MSVYGGKGEEDIWWSNKTQHIVWQDDEDDNENNHKVKLLSERSVWFKLIDIRAYSFHEETLLSRKSSHFLAIFGRCYDSYALLYSINIFLSEDRASKIDCKWHLNINCLDRKASVVSEKQRRRARRREKNKII